MDVSDLSLPDMIFVTPRGETPAFPDLAPPDRALRVIALDLGPRHAPGFWALQLDQAIRDLARPSIVVARGVAALAFAHWALLSPRVYLAGIAGAILVSPREAPKPLQALAATLAIGPIVPLSFPSIVVTDMRSGSLPDTLTLATRWGSQLIDRGAQALCDIFRREDDSGFDPAQLAVAALAPAGIAA